MEKSRYWMWTKRKHDFGTHHDNHVVSSSSSFGDSWEEQAFAEDAAGPLGGCIWPPRSYSCSFCRREFKSAQALGGHMNVHRRDRARLKQSPNPHGGEGELVLQNNNHHILNPCTYLYKRNNSSDPEPDQHVLASSPIRVSAPQKIDDSESEDKTTFSVPAPLFKTIRKKNLTTEQSWSNFVAGEKCCRHVSDSKKNNNNNDEDKKISTTTAATCKSSSESNLSVSLNLLVCRTQTKASDVGDKETSPTSKRRRLIDASSFTLLPKSSSTPPADHHQRCHLSYSSDVLHIKNSQQTSMEDLDLELRLGDPPKVK